MPVQPGRRPAVEERAAVLFRAADWMRKRRSEIAALEVYEAGKPWAEADGDVCEAIDYCEYYGRQMLRLDRGAPVESPPGEENALSTIPSVSESSSRRGTSRSPSRRG